MEPNHNDKIYQFSTIGALMAGHHEGGVNVTGKLSPEHAERFNFGLGCSHNVNAEVTILDGVAYTGTAKEEVGRLADDNLSPFIQLMNFTTTAETKTHTTRQVHAKVDDVNDKNVLTVLKGLTDPENIFVAVRVEATFDYLKIRRPQRINEGETRTMEEIAAHQQVDEFHNVKGTMIGIFTPEIFGRLSVPGFHFHYVSADKLKSGHVLSFEIKEKNPCDFLIEEKTVVEIVLPQSEKYKKLQVKTASLDAVIAKVEK